MSLEHLIATYGYAAIAIGTLFEGETILVLGGFAAHRGYLDLPWVIVCACIGTISGDQFYFYLGRLKGKKTLERRPAWKAKAGKVLSWLDNQQIWLIIGYRFLYGLRSVTPFIIGAGPVSALRFLVLNVIGAALWSAGIGVLGYLCGHTLEIFIGDLKKYEALVFAAAAGLGMLIWAASAVKKRAARRQAASATRGG